MKYKLLHAKWYSFNNAAGENIKGCKLTVLGENVATDYERGCPVLTLSAPYELHGSLQNIPGDYELEVAPKMSQGKPIMVVKSASLIK